MIHASVKPLSSCNLNCLYCNLPIRASARLQIQTVRDFFSTLVRSFPHENFSVKWGGGEPLLMGVDFFQAVTDWQNKLPASFENEISTNLTLLDNAYLDLFKQQNFTIFTSLDGVGQAHDLQRDNSFVHVSRSLLRLKEAGISKVFVNTVCTRLNCESLQQIYNFCVAMNFGWNFTVVVPSGMNRRQAESLMVNPVAFSTAIIEIFDQWVLAQSPIDVLIFSDIIKYTIGMEDYIHRDDPQLTLASDGSLYSCRLLAGNHKFSLGRFGTKTTIETPDCRKCSLHLPNSFLPCQECYFDFLCNLNHCAYLQDVYAHFHQFSGYLCGCLKPTYTHIYRFLETQIHDEPNHQERN